MRRAGIRGAILPAHDNTEEPTRHNAEWYELKEKHWRMLDPSLIFALYRAARLRSAHYLRGCLKAGTYEKNEFNE